jgi:hypothetical protein
MKRRDSFQKITDAFPPYRLFPASAPEYGMFRLWYDRSGKTTTGFLNAAYD